MRILAAILFLTTSLSAFASCPKLTGKYAVCTSTTGADSGSTDMVVEQSDMGPMSVYSVTSTDNDTHKRTTAYFTADGKVRTSTSQMEGTNVTLTTSTKVYCMGNQVIATIVGSVPGQEVFNVTQKTYKSGNQLVTESTGTIFGQSADDKILCE